jgi:hypothetical protein
VRPEFHVSKSVPCCMGSKLTPTHGFTMPRHHSQRRSLKKTTFRIVRLIGVVALLSLFVALIGSRATVAAADPPVNTGAYGYVRQLLGWKNQNEAVEEENKIPEWSVYGAKKKIDSDFGVDDYSTGATIDTATLTVASDDSTSTGTGGVAIAADEDRPPPPKDAPPPLPEEVDVLDEDGGSVVSDLTIEGEDDNDDENDFHDSIADEDEFHDAREEL